MNISVAGTGYVGMYHLELMPPVEKSPLFNPKIYKERNPVYNLKKLGNISQNKV